MTRRQTWRRHRVARQFLCLSMNNDDENRTFKRLPLLYLFVYCNLIKIFRFRFCPKVVST